MKLVGRLVAIAASLLLCLPIAAFAAEVPADATQRGSDTDVSFVYLDSRELSHEDTQYVVAAFTGEVNKPVLNYENVTSGESISVEASLVEDNTALFELSSLEVSEYRLVSISYAKEGGADAVRYFLPLDESMGEGGTFEVTALPSQSGESSGLDIQAFSVDDEGNVVGAGSLEEGLETASNANAQLFSYFRSAKKDFVIVIDPGHGGYDPGACANGLEESALTLKIAKYCQQELSKYAHTRVVMTRTDDTFVDLEPRAIRASDEGADLFVSIHINAGGGTGAEVWIPAPASWNSSFHDLGKELGSIVLDKLAAVGLKDRGTKWSYYGDGAEYPDGSDADGLSVIRNCRRFGIPSVLVEHGFIDNKDDAAKLSNENMLREMGIADAQAIVQKFGLKLPEPLFGFTDVFDTTPHVQEIGWIAASGVSAGYEDGSFRGSEKVLRQDMAAFLYRLAGSPAYAPSSADRARFRDVNNSTPHAKEIWWLASTGISTGYDDGTFRGADVVLRQDMAAFLKRFSQQFNDASAGAWGASGSDRTRFSDVSSSTPHAEDIWWLAAMDVSTGYDDGTYRGSVEVLRQDMAAFLYRVNNLPKYNPSDAEKQAFSDVSDATPFANEVWWLAATGVSTGYDDGTFRGGDRVLRQDMAAFLYRMAGSPAFTPSAEDCARFRDVNEGTPHAKEIWWLASTGISTGYGDGTFHGSDVVLRQDMAAFLKRFYERFSTSDYGKYWTPNNAVKQRFSDVTDATGHAESIWWLAAMGISNGFEDGTFGVDGAIVRQDMAAFLHRLDARAHRTGDAYPYYIMGLTSARADQMVARYKESGHTYPAYYAQKGAATIEDFVRILMEEARVEGVRAEVVFCQSMHETGWLGYGGSVKVEQCNFAGLGATGPTVGGATFPDVRTGLRAQIQHLKAYASTDPLVNPCVDPRFDLVSRGIAPTLTDLNGRWAVPGTDYGQSIRRMINSVLCKP